MNKNKFSERAILITRARIYMHDAYFGSFRAYFRHFIGKLCYKNAINTVSAYLAKTYYYKMHILDLFVHINPVHIKTFFCI